LDVLNPPEANNYLAQNLANFFDAFLRTTRSFGGATFSPKNKFFRRGKTASTMSSRKKPNKNTHAPKIRRVVPDMNKRRSGHADNRAMLVGAI
jgi:hypothetical protein